MTSNTPMTDLLGSMFAHMTVANQLQATQNKHLKKLDDLVGTYNQKVSDLGGENETAMLKINGDRTCCVLVGGKNILYAYTTEDAEAMQEEDKFFQRFKKYLRGLASDEA